ncbi:hypothetical protein OAK75_00845 [Bacteriovoracales bacterium]|nr:hypothetical protein [Bacteriovoracales bacterium]
MKKAILHFFSLVFTLSIIFVANLSYGAGKKPVQQTDNSKEKLNKCNSDKNSCNKQKNNLINERNNCRSSLNSCNDKLNSNASCSGDLDKCNSDLNSKESDLNKCNSDYRTCSLSLGTVSTCNKNLNNCNNVKSSLSGEKSKLESEAKTLKSNITALESTKKNIEEKNQSLSQRNNNLTNEKVTIQKNLNTCNKDLKICGTISNSSCPSELSICNQNKLTAQNNYNSCNKDLNTTKSNKSELEKKLNNCNAVLTTTNDQNGKVKKDLNLSEKNNADLSSKYNSCQSLKAALDNSYNKCNESLVSKETDLLKSKNELEACNNVKGNFEISNNSCLILRDKLNRDIKKCNNDLTKLRGEKLTFENNLTTCNDSLIKYSEEKNLLQTEHNRCNAKVDNFELEKNKCLTSNQLIRNSLKETSVKLEQANLSISQLSNNLDLQKINSKKCEEQKLLTDNNYKSCNLKYDKIVFTFNEDKANLEKLKVEVEGLKLINKDLNILSKKLNHVEKERDSLKKSLDLITKEKTQAENKISSFEIKEKDLKMADDFKKINIELKKENAGMKDYIIKLEQKLKKYEVVPENKFKIVSGNNKIYEDKITQCINDLNSCHSKMNPTKSQCATQIQLRNQEINKILEPAFKKFNVKENNLNTLVFESLNFELANNSEVLNLDLSKCLASKNELQANTTPFQIETWENSIEDINREAESHSSDNPLGYWGNDTSKQKCEYFRSGDSYKTLSFEGSATELVSYSFVNGNNWKTRSPNCSSPTLAGCNLEGQFPNYQDHNLENYKNEKHGAVIFEWEGGACVFGKEDCNIGKTFPMVKEITVRINDKNTSNNNTTSNPQSTVQICFQHLQGDDIYRYDKSIKLKFMENKTDLIYKKILEEIGKLKSQITNEEALNPLKESVLQQLEDELGI